MLKAYVKLLALESQRTGCIISFFRSHLVDREKTRPVDDLFSGGISALSLNRISLTLLAE